MEELVQVSQRAARWLLDNPEADRDLRDRVRREASEFTLVRKLSRKVELLLFPERA